MEAGAVVADAESIELKKEESKNMNKNDGCNKKKEAGVAVVVDSVAGDGEDTNATATAVATGTNSSSQKKKKKKSRKNKGSNRIQVSNTKKPFSFYLSLAKSYIKQYNDIELSALGMAIPTVVTIAEILKKDGLANNKEIKISTVDSKENHKGRFVQKPKIQILMGKAEDADESTDGDTAPKMTADSPDAAAA